MATNDIEQAIFEGWSPESEVSAVEGARYFRNGFLVLGLGSIALGTAAIVGHDLEVGITLTAFGVPATGISVWFENLRIRASERLAVYHRITDLQGPVENGSEV